MGHINDLEVINIMILTFKKTNQIISLSTKYIYGIYL